MPQTKSAKKALRRDRRRKAVNNLIRQKVKQAVKSARKTISAKTLTQAYRELDKAVKKGLVHKNKAARLKSRLGKLSRKQTKEKLQPKKSKRTRKIIKRKV